MIHENLKRIRAHSGATQQQLADYIRFIASLYEYEGVI